MWPKSKKNIFLKSLCPNDDGYVDDGDGDDNDDDDGDVDYIIVMDDAANVEMVSHLHWSLADCWFVVKILCHDLEFEFQFSLKRFQALVPY